MGYIQTIPGTRSAGTTRRKKYHGMFLEMVPHHDGNPGWRGYQGRITSAVHARVQRIQRAAGRRVHTDLRHGGNRAFYSVDGDYIQMPVFGAFRENISYYSTLAHEHTHFTAKDSRCDRQLGKRFGDMAYAAEELIAELGAAFVLAQLGLSTEPREDHSQYINSWLKVLRADSKAIFTAASKAQQATDWMVARAADTSSVEVAA
jgi:antirestriction protein ArdC